MSEEIITHGWDAIDACLRTIYGDQEPQHWGSLIKYCMGGPDPIDGVSAYKRLEPSPHWHFVTYGFSELYGKESDDAEYSGYGFELTFRLACNRDDDTAPVWVVGFLNNLARYVFKSGNVFLDGHHMNLNGPIALGVQTDITGIGFAGDPELAIVSTPNGRLSFLQVIGLMTEEFQAALRWNTTGVVDLIRRQNSLLITDLDRRSITEDVSLLQELEQRSRAEGSTTELIFNDSASWRIEKKLLRPQRIIVSVGAMAARQAAGVLAARLTNNRSFTLVANEHQIEFVSGAPAASRFEETRLTLTIPSTQVDALISALRAPIGEYALSAIEGLVISIQPSLIRDLDGVVVKEIR